MADQHDESEQRAQQLDEALKASQEQERAETQADLERQRRTDEAIVAALAREDEQDPN